MDYLVCTSSVRKLEIRKLLHIESVPEKCTCTRRLHEVHTMNIQG